jgi:prepilin-type N-terminal cleavage/methylation domain-containing protein
MDKKGMTLIELLIVVAIIGILAAISIPAYIGQKKRAARTEAYANLEALRVLEEQYFAENGTYTPDTGTLGTCARNNDNIAAIQAELQGFKPGDALRYSYCIEPNIDIDGTAKTPCFRASAFGNTGTSVGPTSSSDEDRFRIDCDNRKNY